VVKKGHYQCIIKSRKQGSKKRMIAFSGEQYRSRMFDIQVMNRNVKFKIDTVASAWTRKSAAGRDRHRKCGSMKRRKGDTGGRVCHQRSTHSFTRQTSDHKA
jgi:hypothetical protein